MNKRMLNIARIVILICGVALIGVVGACNRRAPTVTRVVSVAANLNPKTEAGFDTSEQVAEHKPFVLEQTDSQPELYLEALNHAKRMPKYSIALAAFVPDGDRMTASLKQSSTTWVSLGPGNIGGRTRGLVIDPRNPNVMYAGAASGGIWKTSDGGNFWKPLTDGMPSLIIGCLSMDPFNPDTLYAGTGEMYTNTTGIGIYKTTDGGATWVHIIPSTFNPSFGYVNAIVVSPNDSQRVYIATGSGGFDGISRSTDGGMTWTKVFEGRRDELGLSSAQGCDSLIIRTDRNKDYIVASCSGVSSAGIYVNPDAGGSGNWTPFLEESAMGRTSLALAPSNQNVMYALAAVSPFDTGGFPARSLHAVFRSIDGGITWTARVRAGDSVPLNRQLLTQPCAGTYSQGDYDNVIAVDPVNPDRVWAGGVGLFRSDDGGANWKLADDGIHPDHHVIAFHPQYDGKTNLTMFAGNDGGIYRTDQAVGKTAQCTGRSDIQWTSLNNNYATTQFYHGAVSSDGKLYIGGTQDNGFLLGTDRSGFNRWTDVWGGDGGVVAFDPADSDTFYLRPYLAPQPAVLKTTDGGINFHYILTGQDAVGSFLPILIDPSNSKNVWVASGGVAASLSRSTNGGKTWTKAASFGPVNAIALPPSNSNIMLAAVENTLYRSDAALTSTPESTWAVAELAGVYISSVAFESSNPNVAYLANGTYRTGDTHSVYKSTDAGLTWQGIDGFGDTALPNIPISTILPDPTRAGRIYIGTAIGVFVSVDRGQSWAQEAVGIAHVGTGTLAMAIANGIPQLYAFTYGRGVWRIRSGSLALKIINVNINGKKLIVTGEGFDSTAVILLNGRELSTSSDPQNPATTLISKKGGKKIKPGQTAIIQVRNGDGLLSNEFQFTRP